MGLFLFNLPGKSIKKDIEESSENWAKSSSQKSKPLSQEFEPSSKQDEVYFLETEFSSEGLSSYC